MTTGLSVFTVRFRKNADSSSVSVPCVMTNPSTSGDLASSLSISNDVAMPENRRPCSAPT